jgi:thermitase
MPRMALLFALVALLGAAAALPAQAQQKRVVVAVVDSGVAPTKQLARRLVPGWDFVDDDADPNDLNGHGTEMASIVASACPRCLIEPVRVLGGSGMGSAAFAVEGIRWAVAHSANVVNLSMTTPSANPELAAAIEQAIAAGVPVVVAAGNAGQPVGYPGAATPDAIVVGSVDPSGARYSWSNYGPWVTLQAPGVFTTTNELGHTVTAVGTSASAGFVSGRAGNLLGCTPALSAPELAAQLKLPPAAGC